MTNKTDLQDRLPRLLDELAETTRIDDTTTDFDPNRLTVVAMRTGDRRNLRPILGAAAAITLVIGGLVVLSNRSEQPATSPPDATPAVSAPPPTTAPTTTANTPPVVGVTFASLPAGFALVEADSDRFAGYEWKVQTRFYTADPDKPETAATFAVTMMPADSFVIDIPADAITVALSAVDGSIYDHPQTGARTVSYQLNDNVYTITGYRVTDDEIIAVANNTRPAGTGHDNYGAVVDPAGLPDGVEEVYIGGSWFERWFIGKNALTQPIPMARWDSDTSSLWAMVVQQNPRWLPLGRIGWDTVTDTTIHGQPAFVVSTADQPGFLSISWVEDGAITYMVGSQGLDEATLIELAEQLQPATTTEWNDMVATTVVETTQTVPPTNAASTTDSGPASMEAFCAEYASLQDRQSESYVGSSEHLADIDGLLAVAPDSVTSDLATFRDYLSSGAIDSDANPDSNLTENWPSEVQSAIASTQAFAAENC